MKMAQFTLIKSYFSVNIKSTGKKKDWNISTAEKLLEILAPYSV